MRIIDVYYSIYSHNYIFLMDKELFNRYLNNQCHSEEIDEIFNWFRDEASSINNRRKIKVLWNEFSPTDDSLEDDIFERILDKIHHKINLSDSDYKRKTIKRNRAAKYNKVYMYLTKSAAILFIPILLTLIFVLSEKGHFYNRQAFNEIGNIEVTSPIGSRTYIELPDGTGVHLNHGSKLIYPRRFSGKKRIVELMGEGYFNVITDPQMPFCVCTDNLEITALGTEFNVMAYSGLNNIETTLIKGKVVVKQKTSTDKTIDLKTMNPGEHLRYSNINRSYVCTTDYINKYISWKDGILIFKDDTLEEIVLRLGRWYNVEFIFKDDSVKKFPYTATFVDETLTQILDLLEIATPIKYEITPRIKKDDGTFTKQQIIIDLQKRL